MIISLGPRTVENQTSQKKAAFQVIKVFGLFFLVLSSLANFRGQFVRIQKAL